MAIGATYVSSTVFTVEQDQTSLFTVDRLTRLDCGSDGYKYGTITNCVYTTLTTVTIAESVITSNLESAVVGIIQSGTTGSLPNHAHNDGFGQGGIITITESSISDLDKYNQTEIINMFSSLRQTGFENRNEDSTIFWDSDGSIGYMSTPRTLYIYGSFQFRILGTVFTRNTTINTAEYIQIPDTPFPCSIYYNSSGVLSYTEGYMTEKEFKHENCAIAVVIWVPTYSKVLNVADNRHGIDVPWALKDLLGTVIGFKWHEGLALGDFTFGTGDDDADAQLSVSDGSFYDAEIIHSAIDGVTQNLNPILYAPVMYRLGDVPLYTYKDPDEFPVIYNDGVNWTGVNIPYNQYTGGAWQLTQVTNNNYVCYHILGTADIKYPIFSICGTAQYSNISNAIIGATNEMNTIFNESIVSDDFKRGMLPLGTVLFQTASGYSNTPKCRIVQVDGKNYIDWRTKLYYVSG